MKPVCLVIGAGAGIGGTVARRFAQEGYHAVLCRRSDSDGLSRLVDAITSDGGSATGFLLNAIEADSAVCPAGEDVIGPFLADRKTHLKEIVRPLQEKDETIYVTKNSDAEASVAKRFPRKKIKHVGNSLRPNIIKVFLLTECRTSSSQASRRDWTPLSTSPSPAMSSGRQLS